MFETRFDPARRRLHIRYSGLWSHDEACRFVDQFRAVLRDAARGGSFTLLDDLREWPTQTQDVAQVTAQLPDLVRAMPVSRNAMIIPQAILRMQVSRTLVGLDNCAVFKSYEEADAWLNAVEPAR